MKVLVLGGTGATGRFVVRQLLSKGYEVVVIVRSPDKIRSLLDSVERLEIIEGDILSMDDNSVEEVLSRCDCAISCLGHNISFKGIYGKPRKLVRDSIKRVYEYFNSIESQTPKKIILMNTTGNRDKQRGEKLTFGETLVIWIMRALLPPHRDNEKAAGYLQKQGLNSRVEWVAVRPDSLIDSESVSEYQLCPSPVRSAIFDPGKTSRINVGDFIVNLYLNSELWTEWKGRLPVIYNK